VCVKGARRRQYRNLCQKRHCSKVSRETSSHSTRLNDSPTAICAAAISLVSRWLTRLMAIQEPGRRGEPNPERFVARVLKQSGDVAPPLLPANSVAIPVITKELLSPSATPWYQGTLARYLPSPSVTSRQSRVGCGHRRRSGKAGNRPSTRTDTRQRRVSSPSAQKGGGLYRSNEQRLPVPSRPPSCVTDAERRRDGTRGQ